MFITDATHLPWIMNCNGSRLLPDTERTQDVDTTLREEGNAWHWLSQQAFDGRIDITSYQTGYIAPNGVPITPQMFEHARQYLGSLCCGEMETVTSWDGAGFLINGRADHIGYDSVADILYVDDGKYGYSIVEPENNWTLISHAIGWTIKNQHVPREIRLRIHQPRPYHPDGPLREAVMSGDDLRARCVQISNTLTNPSDYLNTGQWCNKCSKNGKCPAFRAANMNAIDVMQVAFTDDIDDETLADEIRTCEYAFKLMKSRLDALKDMGTHRVKHGHVVPGFVLERTYSNTTWRKGVTAEWVKIMTGRDISEPKLPTPAVAKTLGIAELILNGLTERVETGVKLVPMSAKKTERLLGKSQ